MCGTLPATNSLSNQAVLAVLFLPLRFGIGNTSASTSVSALRAGLASGALSPSPAASRASNSGHLALVAPQHLGYMRLTAPKVLCDLSLRPTLASQHEQLRDLVVSQLRLRVLFSRLEERRSVPQRVLHVLA